MNEAEFRRLQRKQKIGLDKQENSFAGIYENLMVIGDTTKDTDAYILIIIEVLLKIPKKVRRKIIDEVTFVIVGDSTFGTIYQLVFSKDIINKYILLNFSAMEKAKKSKSYMRSCIAHEIAHIALGHTSSNLYDKFAERKADNLTEKWGFARTYKTYKHFENRR